MFVFVLSQNKYGQTRKVKQLPEVIVQQKCVNHESGEVWGTRQALHIVHWCRHHIVLSVLVGVEQGGGWARFCFFSTYVREQWCFLPDPLLKANIVDIIRICLLSLSLKSDPYPIHTNRSPSNDYQFPSNLSSLIRQQGFSQSTCLHNGFEFPASLNHSNIARGTADPEYWLRILSLFSVTNLATRLRHLHCHIALDCPIGNLVLSLYLH